MIFKRIIIGENKRKGKPKCFEDICYIYIKFNIGNLVLIKKMYNWKYLMKIFF